ncbi:unnamed protein product [Somion occarium]|uniref:Uncharacterized protein n=1 Tax=Somion occarium TaxID=3059160 RepID=A0ABP1DFQ8_9APHY
MAPTPPASPFAALLRRSKFASYDPHIGQVYATFGGDASRGNWGLKRPLPLRKRQAYITVKAIDSREQQTEWKSAEQQSRWIRMYDEVGMPPKLSDQSQWIHKIGPVAELQWTVDSEFATKDANTVPSGKYTGGLGEENIPENESERARAAREEGVFARDVATPNISAMSEKEFEAYLRKLRALRPQFRKYLQAKVAFESPKHAEPEPLPSFWEISDKLKSSSVPRDFLSSRQYKKYTEEGSRLVEQQPHRFGGLTYSCYNTMQSWFYSPPKPGRILSKGSSTARGSNTDNMRASFAGMSAHLPAGLRDQRGPMDWTKLSRSGDRNPTQGVAPMRLVEATLYNAPETVGEHPEDLVNTSLQATVQVVGEQGGMSQGNPHPPGSREYVAQVEGVGKNLPIGIFKVQPKKPAAPSLDETPVDSGKLGTLAMVVETRPLHVFTTV